MSDPVFSLDSSEGALVKLAMGPQCRLCVFEPAGFGYQLMALWPPFASVPSAQHDNASSREICSVMHHSRYDWNDLYAVAPKANEDVKSSALLKLVSERKIPSLMTAWHGRMERHVSLHADRGDVPVVVVAGRVANAAFAQLPYIPITTVDICGFLVSRYASFVALLHVPHPSSHLRHANAPAPRVLFRSAYQLANALQLRPTATADELLAIVDESVRTQHRANARAIEALDLPGCVGSWFSDDLRHLRLVDWELALPKCLALQQRLDPAQFVAVLKNSPAFRLSEPPFHAAMISWLDALGPARFATFVCDGVAARLADPAFTVALNRWLDALGPGKFATFVCNSVAARLVDPAFTVALNRWLDALGTDRFAGLLRNNVACRWQALDTFVMTFLANTPGWTRDMTDDLCRHFPVDHPVAVDPTIYRTIWAARRRR